MIDENKFDISINKIYEIGKIVGGLIKYYAKNYQKCKYYYKYMDGVTRF